MLENTISSLKELNSKEFILYHHLGLGDSIVCNGMVNYLTQKNKMFIHLPSNTKNFSSLEFLYSGNPNVKVFEIDNKFEMNNVLSYSKQKSLQILKVGFENRTKGAFNVNFNKQLKLPYKISFKYFHLPEIQSKYIEDLESHLKNYYGVSSKNYNLVHTQSSEIDFKIVINNDFSSIYVEKNTDIFKNIFYYVNLIKDATEIHCVNSSFIHLVERIDTKSKLFYHDNRKGILKLKKNWKKITY